MSEAIDHIQFSPVSVRLHILEPYALNRPFTDGTGGPFHRFGFSILEVRDSDGVSGMALTDSSLAGYFQNQLFPFLLNPESRQYRDWFRQLYWSIRNAGFRGPAASAPGALDRALHDLAAKKAGLPLHRFLGATRDFANAYACGGSTSHSETELVAEVESFLRQGFTTIKIKVGLGFGAHPETDVLRVKAIRKNLGYSFSLAIDANQAFSAGQAINLSEKLSEEQIAWFEEPVHSAEHSSIRLYARKGTIPSAFGESEYSGKVFPQLVQNGVQHLQPSPDMLTSLAEFFEISALAYKYGLPVSSGGYSWENCEYTAALNESSLTEYLEPVVGGMRSFMESAPELREGRFLLQSYPGSSIRFDLEGLKKGGILQTVTLAGK